MSDLLLSFLISVGILAAMWIFVPMLHVCNAGCQRFFGRKARAEQMEAEALQPSPETEAREAA